MARKELSLPHFGRGLRLLCFRVWGEYAHPEGKPGLTHLLSSGVDDAESECGLDNFGTFDWVIENHGDKQHLEEQLRHLTEFIQRVIVES